MPKRSRRLWLNVKWKIRHDPSRETVLRHLVESIESGSYDLPKTYKVAIGWRNNESALMKWGAWKTVLEDSAASSPGFDSAMLDYLARF
jgi:hypothetical protein